MLKEVIEECFADIRANGDPNEGKAVFGNIWAALAGKRARFGGSEVFLDWRSLSAELAKIYNEWYNQRFTTDAFLRARDPETPLGRYPDYDDAVMRLCQRGDCGGIFLVRIGCAPTYKRPISAFAEVNVVTGEESFYKQEYKNGRAVGPHESISSDEFEQICYSTR